MLSKDSDSEESELENNREICTLLLQNVTFPKPKKRQTNFAEFYSVLNECRREAKNKLQFRLEGMKNGLQTAELDQSTKITPLEELNFEKIQSPNSIGKPSSANSYDYPSSPNSSDKPFQAETSKWQKQSSAMDLKADLKKNLPK